MECECYECGRVAVLGPDTFWWACPACGYDQGTGILEEALLQQAGDDILLERLARSLIEDHLAPVRSDEGPARAAAAAIRLRITRAAERLATARASFLRTARPRLAEIRSAVAGASTGADAWNRLVAAGLISPEPRPRFWTDFMSHHPIMDTTAVAFAASGPAIAEAERCFRDLCAAIGHDQEPVWDDIDGTPHCLLTIEALRIDHPLLRHADTDADYAALAAEVLDLDPNPFVALTALYATGATIEAYEADESGRELIVLHLAPLQR